MWDFTLLRQMTETLPWDSPVTNRALYIANAIMNEFDPVDLKSLKRCRKIAEGMLGEDWEKKIEASRDEGEDKDGTLWGIGHWCAWLRGRTSATMNLILSCHLQPYRHCLVS